MTKKTQVNNSKMSHVYALTSFYTCLPTYRPDFLFVLLNSFYFELDYDPSSALNLMGQCFGCKLYPLHLSFH